MKSLAACIKKAGKAISPADAEFLNAARQEFIDEGMKSSEASERAIKELINIADSEIDAIGNQITNSGGSFNREQYNLKPEENSEILYRTDTETETFEAPEYGWVDRSVEYIQNKLLSLKKVQQEIFKSGNIITDEMNAYVKEELLHEKAALDLEEIQDNFIQPVIDSLNEHKLDQKELDLFLIAKHAKERNKLIRERNPDIQDGGSGMTDAEAETILNQFDSEGKTQALEQTAQHVYAMLNNKNNRLNEAGTLSDAQQQSWEETFSHYVPLKGFQAGNQKQEILVIGKIGKGFNIRGKESMRALGRRTLSASPFVSAIQDATAAVLRARKNEVGQAFLKLVQANPKPGYWSVHTKDNPFMAERYDPNSGTVERKAMNPWEMTPQNGFLTVKVDGEEHYIKLEDERLLAAMTNLGPETMSGVVKMMATAVRFLSALNTSLNPEFMISNALRDIQTAMYNALAETDMKDGKLRTIQAKKAFAAKLANPKTIFSAMRGINAAIKDHTADSEWAQHYHDFREQGAKTGFFDMKSFDEQAKELENLIAVAQGGFKGQAIKYFRKSRDFIDRMNTAVENGVRLVAYVNAVDAGLTKQKAASLAKNLTVNFNRKGRITWLNAIYMFGNASVQGTAQFIRSIGANPVNHPSGKVKLNLAQKAAVTMSMAGYMLSMLSRELGGEDDDGEKWIDKVPDHVLERNIVIMKSVLGGDEDGSYWAIPLPYGYNIFHNLGTAVENMSNGSNRKDLGWASRFITFSALGSFSPIGMNESKKGLETALIKTATPTLFKPFIELAVDENFFGNKIYRNDAYDRFDKPDSLGKASTAKHWKNISTWLNEITGGDTFTPGLIDVAPESFQHVITAFAGGVGRLAENTLDATNLLIEGDELPDRKTPFYRKVSGQVLHFQDRDDFEDRKDEIYQAAETLKSLPASDKIAYRRDRKDLLSLTPIAKATEKKLRALWRKKKRVLYSDKPEDKLRLKKIEEQEQAAITQFNRRYNLLFNN